MENTVPVWVIPALTFVAGIILGVILARILHRSAPENTQNQLNDLQERFESYQGEVVAHFSTTAGLVNKLTENYHNVQEHLLQSAERLALDEESRERLLNSLMDNKGKERLQPPAEQSAPEAEAESDSAPAAAPEAPAEPETIEPPKDYASKKEGEVGTLDESFGHKKPVETVEAPSSDVPKQA